MADWKRVLLETDITQTVTNGVTTTVPSEDAVYDAIQTAISGLSSTEGTVTSVIAGAGMTQTGTSTINPTLNVIGGDGITANADEIEVTVDGVTIELSATNGSGAVRAKTAAIADGGTGLATADQIHAFVTGLGYTTNTGTVTSVSSATTSQLTVANGTTTPSLTIVTGAVADGGTALATGDQIHAFVTGLGYTTNSGTVTSVIGGDNITSDGSTVVPTLDLDQNLLAMISMSGVNAATSGDVNLSGGDLTFTSGLSTGTGVGGDIFFKASDPGSSSGMTQNAAVDVMKIAAATTNGGDPVVTIYGDLVVNGATSSVDVQTLTVEDKTILVADGAGTAANATSAGLIVDTSGTAANRANFLWKDSSAGVAGWEFKDDGAVGSYPSMGVAALTKGAADPTSSIMPTGALFYNDGTAGTKGLYLYLD